MYGRPTDRFFFFLLFFFSSLFFGGGVGDGGAVVDQMKVKFYHKSQGYLSFSDPHGKCECMN